MMEMIEQLADKLKKRTMPPRVLLSKFRMLEESSRISAPALDPLYLPFYFHLGTVFPAKNLLEFGFGIGLCSGSYLMANKHVESFLAFQQKEREFYSPRIGEGNIRLAWGRNETHVGNVVDKEFVEKLTKHRWALVMLNERNSSEARMHLAWDNLSDGGLMVVDNLQNNDVKRAYEEFCRTKRRTPVTVNTRYGVGLAQK